MAKGIVEGRPYKSVDDLERVKGLGKVRIESLRGLVTTGPASAAAEAETGSPAATAPASEKVAAKSTARTPAKKAAARLAPGKKVNINNASREDLDALPGIGEVKSQAIIDARPFKTIEDIMKVKGIKEHEFSIIKDMITVN